MDRLFTGYIFVVGYQANSIRDIGKGIYYYLLRILRDNNINRIFFNAGGSE